MQCLVLKTCSRASGSSGILLFYWREDAWRYNSDQRKLVVPPYAARSHKQKIQTDDATAGGMLEKNKVEKIIELLREKKTFVKTTARGCTQKNEKLIIASTTMDYV